MCKGSWCTHLLNKRLKDVYVKFVSASALVTHGWTPEKNCLILFNSSMWNFSLFCHFSSRPSLFPCNHYIAELCIVKLYTRRGLSRKSFIYNSFNERKCLLQFSSAVSTSLKWENFTDLENFCKDCHWFNLQLNSFREF